MAWIKPRSEREFVEALDSLQTIALERSDFIPGAFGAQHGSRVVHPISR